MVVSLFWYYRAIWRQVLLVLTSRSDHSCLPCLHFFVHTVRLHSFICPDHVTVLVLLIGMTPYTKFINFHWSILTTLFHPSALSRYHEAHLATSFGPPSFTNSRDHLRSLRVIALSVLFLIGQFFSWCCTRISGFLELRIQFHLRHCSIFPLSAETTSTSEHNRVNSNTCFINLFFSVYTTLRSC